MVSKTSDEKILYGPKRGTSKELNFLEAVCPTISVVNLSCFAVLLQGLDNLP